MKKWTAPRMTVLTSEILKSEITVNAHTCILFFVR